MEKVCEIRGGIKIIASRKKRENYAFGLSSLPANEYRNHPSRTKYAQGENDSLALAEQERSQELTSVT